MHLDSDRYVIFPYKVVNEKASLYSEEELSDLFPSGYEYLKACEPELRAREKGRLEKDTFWYRYIYPKNLTLFDQIKIVAPEISLGGNFTIDSDGRYYSTTKVYGYVKKKNIPISYPFLLGILNSAVFWFFIQNTGYDCVAGIIHSRQTMWHLSHSLTSSLYLWILFRELRLL